MAVGKPVLYSAWISSCSFRVRIALNLKDYEKINPIKYVPALVDGDFVVSDSLAIILTSILNTLFCLKISKRKLLICSNRKTFGRSKYPLLERFYKAYMEIPAFQVAVPEKQPDAPSPGV
nr:unnamed protein product [Digitaria exilis]